MRRLLTLSALAFALWGCTRPETPSQQLPVTPAPTEPVLVEPFPAQGQVTQKPKVAAALSLPGVNEPAVRIADTAELTVRARVEHLEGTGKLSLLLVSPDGNAYAVGAWQLEGDGAPIEKDLTVPVRGTAIEDHRLTGDWKAQLTLDGQPVGTLVVELL